MTYTTLHTSSGPPHTFLSSLPLSILRMAVFLDMFSDLDLDGFMTVTMDSCVSFCCFVWRGRCWTHTLRAALRLSLCPRQQCFLGLVCHPLVYSRFNNDIRRCRCLEWCHTIPHFLSIFFSSFKYLHTVRPTFCFLCFPPISFLPLLMTTRYHDATGGWASAGGRAFCEPYDDLDGLDDQLWVPLDFGIGLFSRLNMG